MKHVPEQVILGTRHPLYMAYLRARMDSPDPKFPLVTWDAILEHATQAEFDKVAHAVAADRSYDPVANTPPASSIMTTGRPRKERRTKHWG